ncbi:ATP-dependent acyl-CoA ligase [Nocardioides ginsengisoli]|uniref:AMP-binding protein n=1 Tax=Nocardioides ginsengisoli TaxID=363868 RepID=A0ABW3VUK7_9ACTN
MGNETVYSRLQDQAAQSPDAPVLLVDGRDYTRSELHDAVRGFAAGLTALGLERGDRAVIVMDNRFEAVSTWLGVNAAGVIDVPINSEAKGAHLQYLVSDCAPRVLIGQPEYLRQVAAVMPAPPQVVIVVDPDEDVAPCGEDVPHHTYDEVLALGRDAEVPLPREDEIATMIYTSGTTGPSKGVLLPQRYHVAWASIGMRSMGMQPGQTVYTPEPLFHSDARSYVVAALIAGGRVALARRFSVSSFWDDVRAADATYFAYLGTMLSLLWGAEPKADDADNPAVIGLGGAAPAAIHEAFEERFGVTLLEMYGMTEALGMTMNSLDDRRVGSIGKPVDEIEALLVDADDRPVPVGEVGELVVRPKVPNIMMAGYWAKPEATIAAWRNLWFHTGDRMKADEDGFLYYIGRLKDSIRRRGENVSAWEVEMAMCRHDDVLTAAAIGVPSALGEEDVAALVVPKEGHTIDPQELHRFLTADLPRFAVPRYIEVVDSLPKTPTERVNKDLVRTRGLSAAAWDAEAGDRGRVRA